MLNEIKKFMQNEDQNGTWYECTPADKGYMLETLREWSEDGMDVTPRVQSYMDWLQQ